MSLELSKKGVLLSQPLRLRPHAPAPPAVRPQVGVPVDSLFEPGLGRDNNWVPLLAPIGPLLAPIGPYWPLLASIGPY